VETTAGQVLINQMLPEDMRDHSRVLDKKGIKQLYTDLAEKHPDKYAEINYKLHNIAHEAATRHGNVASFSLDALRTPDSVRKIHGALRKRIDEIMAGPGDAKEKNHQVVKLISDQIDTVTNLNYEEGRKENNPFAYQVLSGSRGNANQFRSLRGGDLLVSDHNDNPIPVPILSSFSEGLDPVQFWASTYGARKGEISKKFSSPESGFLGKQLAMSTHRLIVTEADCGTSNGIPVPAADKDNEGALLAQSAGGVKAGTPLTPKHLRELGEQNILVRSPITCQSSHGVCQKCAGVRESGTLPKIGENIGISAAQALSEPLTNATMKVRHAGGQYEAKKHVAGKSGLDLINQIVEVPRTFHAGAAIAQSDGRVDAIEVAPQGGQYITIKGMQHWVPPDVGIKVAKGDMVDAGDVLSEGLPNPAEIVKHKGIGEGRRYFMDIFKQAMDSEKFGAHRRNIELLSRGLVNHVRITDRDGPADTVPDDVVEYDNMIRGYQPRFGYKSMSPKQAVGLYLEAPVLHYSVGTRVSPKVASQLETYKVPAVTVHADPPSFEPEMTRAMETLSHSNDWMVRLGGFHLKKGLIESVHRARKSETHGTSFIPALAQGSEFGKAPQGAGY
jgi:hypothetical protein